jgi:hypothetical protein
MKVTQGGRLHLNQSPKTAIDYAAILLSYIFHPILLIVWTTLYLLYLNPMIFIGVGAEAKMLVLLRVIGTSVFLPFMTVVLLKGLGFIDSIRLETQKERIIPYVACITFFFWSYYVAKKLEDPFDLRAFFLSLFLTASVSLLINNYIKISMHAIGFGGVNALMVLMLFAGRLNDGFILCLSFLLAGLVGAARIKRLHHHPFEIYLGYFTGISVQMFSWWFLL